MTYMHDNERNKRVASFRLKMIIPTLSPYYVLNENVLTMRVATLVLNMERLNAMQVITLDI